MIVKVCDCIPGAGKTEASIAMMKSHPEKKYLFVTPYLTEVERIKASCSELYFKEPEDGGRRNPKIDSLHELIKAGENIAQSHALFAYYTEETRSLIRENGYTLILDEVMNVMNKERVSASDIQALFDAGFMELEEDGFHVRWLREDYNGAFRNLKKKAQLHNLFVVDNALLFWSIPIRSFDAFEDVYVLTYLFRAQIQRYYYEINGIEFKYIGVRQTENGYEFAPAGELPAYARTLIDKVHILDEVKANRIGDEPKALSSNWYRNDRGSGSPKGQKIKELGNTTYNVLHNRFAAKASDVIWTTFKEQRDVMERQRYKARFLSCSTRATNAYANCHYLAYCINVFFNPDINRYLNYNGADVDQDLYALSEMIQWVWRSAIRKGEEIWIYVPSARMRTLFRYWLEALAAGEDVGEYIAAQCRESVAKKARAAQEQEEADMIKRLGPKMAGRLLTRRRRRKATPAEN